MPDDEPGSSSHVSAGPAGSAAGLTVDIIPREPRWRRADIDLALLERAARAAEAACSGGDTAPREIAVLLTDDAECRELNRAWRGRDAATDVLSFPNDMRHVAVDGPRPIGDIVLAFETVARDAGDAGKSLDAHAAHLVVHGVLHLMGHDHESPGEAERMEDGERCILAGLGIDDPYAFAPAGDAGASGKRAER